MIQDVYKVSNKKLSCLSSAIHNRKKLLLVGSFDGKIIIVIPKENGKVDGHLIGHELAPLAIKVFLLNFIIKSLNCI